MSNPRKKQRIDNSQTENSQMETNLSTRSNAELNFANILKTEATAFQYDYPDSSTDDSQSKLDQHAISFETAKSSKIRLLTKANRTVSLSKSSLKCLYDRNHLNDDILNFYLQYIKYRLIPEDVSERTHIFNSFFFSKMMQMKDKITEKNHLYQKIYQKVKHYTSKIDVLEYDFLIIPIFDQNHWCVAIVCYAVKLLGSLNENSKERPCIILLDSSGKMKNTKTYVQLIRNWLENELQAKIQGDRNIYEKQLPAINPSTPKQSNDNDCGLFVLHYVEEFLKKPEQIFATKRLARVKLNDWFEQTMTSKRLAIVKELTKLHNENKKNLISFSADDEIEEDDDEDQPVNKFDSYNFHDHPHRIITMSSSSQLSEPYSFLLS